MESRNNKGVHVASETGHWPKLNLARYQMTRLSFGARLQGSKLGDLVPPPDDSLQLLPPGYDAPQYVGARNYRRGKANHLIVENAFSRSDDGTVYDIDVDYRIDDESPLSPVPPPFRHIGLTRQLLGACNQIEQLGALAEFRYESDSAEELVSIFPLPFSLGGSNYDFPIDEVVGIRALKFSDDKREQLLYRVQLDRPPDGSLDLKVWLHESFIDAVPDIPETLQNRFVAIAARLVSVPKE